MIRVVVVDDSGIARRAISDALRATNDIEVVATAADGDAAIAAIRTHRPDVATFDVEMPGLDGISLLQLLMRSEPLPVIIISSTTQRGSQAALRALEVGAVEVLAKPSIAELPEFAGRLARAVRAAASARIRGVAHAPTPTPARTPLLAPGHAPTHTPIHNLSLAPPAVPRARTAERATAPGPAPSGHPAVLIAIGASTGGTEAIASILARLPGQSPGIVIVQHLPGAFTASFAKRLDSLSELTVVVAADGEEILAGHAYIAQGGRHLAVRMQRDRRLVLALEDGPPEHFQCPAADVLFRSVAAAVGPHALGVLLTGMGHDGAAGLLAMRRSGALTIAQDEASCVVYGMPRAAVELGAAVEQLSLEAMPERLVRAACAVEPGARIAPVARSGYTGKDARIEEPR